jgi:dihydroneopterin aldolase
VNLPAGSPGVIELRGLRVLGRHGVGEAERSVPQPFELDLEVTIDIAGAVRSDEVSETVDYGSLATEVHEIVSESSYRLLETLATAVAAALLAHDRVTEVTVTVRKLRPPVPVDLATAGVRITRFRA